MPLIEIALKENIYLFSLPSHTSHKTRPLDVGIFGPTQRYWGEKCDELADIGLKVTKENVILVYSSSPKVNTNRSSQATKCSIFLDKVHDHVQ
jgi:hypothetical protein